jgi:2-phosphosulfolactate phosphatase
MQVHVAFTPDEAASAPTGVVIDVLRATSTIAQALAAGYVRVLCVPEIEDARALRAELEDSVVGGERNAIRIDGFDVGASPREMLEPRGETLILTTTNGTSAIVTAAARCERVLLGSLLNLDAVVAAARGHGDDVAILCAGFKGAFALDDAYCAGRLAAAALGSRKARRGLNDAAIASLDLVRRYGDRWERPLTYSRAGRELIRLGFRDDVLDAARLDAYPVLAYFHDRRMTLAPVPV